MFNFCARNRLIYSLLALSLSTGLSTGLAACGPAPVATPSASPVTSASPSLTGPLASVSPTPDPLTRQLVVRLQADASLAGFATSAESPLTLCLSQIFTSTTRISQNGTVIDTSQQGLGLRELLEGNEILFNGLSPGPVEGRTSFFNDAGSELGFVSWQAQFTASPAQVTVTLKGTAETHAGDSCPRLAAEVTGGTILGAGGQVVNTTPLPNPVTTPTPNPSPSTAPNVSAPELPTGLQIVEQTSTSLTLQWEFAGDPVSYALFLDGHQVAGNHTSPNYYRFEGLNASTQYTLGVQAVSTAGVTGQIASLSSTTLSAGHSGSGNFSGGGSSGPRESVLSTLTGSFGDEFQVNTFTTGTQSFAVVAIDKAGDYVVVWQDRVQEGSSYGIYARRYDHNDDPLGSEFQVNTYTTQSQADPAVAMDDDGDFVVTWQSYEQDGSNRGIFARRYDSAGNPGSEFQVNTFTTSAQFGPSIAMDDDGGFVIAWTSNTQDGSNGGIYAQLYDSQADPLGSEFQVNTYTSNHQVNVQAAMDADGDFVLTWVSLGQDGNYYGIFAQRFQADGAPQGSEFQVNTYTTGRQNKTDVAMDDEGDFVITWQSSEGNEDPYYGILAQRYSSRGTRLGDEFLVNTLFTGAAQNEPHIAMDGDGDFVIGWYSYEESDLNTLNADVYIQRYHPNGDPVGNQFLINTYTTGRQEPLEIAMDSSGDFVMTWGSYEQDGNDYGIFARRFEAD
ncbi:MAG: fibronectin type III domain-containing protein [Candidatus Sericytochromatia bacterium]